MAFDLAQGTIPPQLGRCDELIDPPIFVEVVEKKLAESFSLSATETAISTPCASAKMAWASSWSNLRSRASSTTRKS